MLSSIANSLTRLQPGEQVLIVDAGGGTIDISTYKVLNTRPLRVEELYEPKCELDGLRYPIFCLRVPFLGLLQGGEFVTARARAMVQGALYVFLPGRLLNPPPGKLRGSRFNTPGDLDAFSHKFDEGVKRVFSNDQAPQYVKFGSLRDNDPDCGIKAGRLALTG